jgi:Uma2 family endonuclease
MLERRLIARRRRLGLDQWDEVWEGTYVMVPPADIEQFEVSGELASVLTVAVKWAGLGEVYSGVAISDRVRGWKQNIRVPDVAVFLHGNPAQDCRTHWCGGPDLAIEVVSPRDRTRRKIPFYEQLGTRELLLVERRPWRLTLLRLCEGKLREADQSTCATSAVLSSNVVPLRFQLVDSAGRPEILLARTGDGRQWRVKSRS